MSGAYSKIIWQLLQNGGALVGTTGDRIYPSDIDVDFSDNGSFSGGVSDYFDSLKTVNEDRSSTNPKTIKVWFGSTIFANSIGLGCDELLLNFSNTKVSFLGSGEAVRAVVDNSADSTKRNSQLLEFSPLAFNGLLIEFYTSDPVGLSNIVIPKEIQTTARIKAKKDNGIVTDIGATNNENLRVSVQEYGDTASVDAFARLRVSSNFTIFDSKQLHDKQPLFWDELIGGGATSTHSVENASTQLSVGANVSDYVIRQTRQRFNYQPGKSQLVFFTFLCNCVPGVTKRLGLFDGTGTNALTPNNGIFFETGNGPCWNIAKNGGVTESIPQAQWNVDPLDGTGASGITLDLEAAQIGVIDFEWLGVGRVRVGFVIDGLIYYVHYFNHANDPTFDSVYMSSPNLPLRYSIESDGVSSSTLDHICSSVISEGGIEKTGILRVVDNDAVPLTALSTGVTYAMLGIRLKQTHLDITVIPETLSVMCSTNDLFRWSLLFNPTVSGVFAYSDVTNSSIQKAIGTNANVISDAGLEIASGYASSQSRESDQALNTAQRIGSTILGVPDGLILAITPLSSNMSAYGSLNFRELL